MVQPQILPPGGVEHFGIEPALISLALLLLEPLAGRLASRANQVMR